MLKKLIYTFCFIWALFLAGTVVAQSSSQNSPPNRVFEQVEQQLNLLQHHKPLWSYDYIKELHNLPSYDIKTFYRLSGLEALKKQHKVA
jgi:hypothetical protein